VLKYGGPGRTGSHDGFEYHRPWAYPTTSVTGAGNSAIPTPTETYDPSASDGTAPPGAYKPLRAGPYPVGTQPDVFFRLDAPVDAAVRHAYEQALTPWQTDQLNEAHIGLETRIRLSPLGDPIPFSSHLIGQLVNDTGYATQFNLDSDRAFAYLTWDWIRGDATDTGILGLTYNKPKEPPEGENGWSLGVKPLQLHYVDAPVPPAPPPLR
jgi:hypothetical protein